MNKGKSHLYNERIVPIFNFYFRVFQEEDLQTLRNKLKEDDYSGWLRPEANGLLALADLNENSGLVPDWLRIINEGQTIENQIDILLKAASVFSDIKSSLTDYAFELYAEGVQAENEGKLLGDLMAFISENVHTESQRNRLLEIQDSILRKGVGNIDSLANYWDLVKATDKAEGFFDVFRNYAGTSMGEAVANESCVCIILDYYEATKDVLAENRRLEVAACLCSLASQVVLSVSNCTRLANICAENEMNFEAEMFDLAAKEMMKTATLPYSQVVLDILSSADLKSFAEKIRNWSQYYQITEEDRVVIERMRNTIKTPELWLGEEIDVLAKALINEPSNSVFWKLMQSWEGGKARKNEVVMGNILYQLSYEGIKELATAMNYAIDNNLKPIAVELVLKMMKVRMPDYCISAQKAIRSMIKKGWHTEERLKEAAPEFLDLIYSQVELTGSTDYKWNSICAAFDLAKYTDNFEIFLNLFAEYLKKDCAKQCCVVAAELILRGQQELLTKVKGYLDACLLTLPYKELVLDFIAIVQQRGLSEAEKEVLRCIEMDYGNQLGVDDLLSFYCKMNMQDNTALGVDVARILQKYTPDDPVLYELEACFMKNISELEDYVCYYNLMLNYLKRIQVENPVEFAIGQMICGENFLHLQGRQVESFTKMVDEHYPRLTPICKTYQEFCDCIIVELRSTACEDFGSILLSSIFKGDWRPIFEYKPGDEAVETVLRNLKTNRINVADSYCRTIIKSTALFFLEHNEVELPGFSERIRRIWDLVENKGCGFKVFSELLQQVDKKYIPELNRIWNLDIETITIFKKFFGGFILSQENCEEYADVFSVLLNARSMDVFKNAETQEILSGMERERAIKVAYCFENLYLQTSSQAPGNQTKKNVLRDSDYEDNVFSAFLKRNDADYSGLETRCARFKRKYDLICRLYAIQSCEDANSERFALYTKRQIFSLRALYFYFSVLAQKEYYIREFDEEDIYPDLINAITIALSNDLYLVHLNQFLEYFEPEERQAAAVVILVEKGQLENAYNALERIANGPWKKYLASCIIAAFGSKGKKNEAIKKCYEIVRMDPTGRHYWIRNIVHCKSLNELNENMFIPDAEQNDTPDLPDKEEALSDRLQSIGKSITVEEQQESDIIEHTDYYEADYIQQFMKTEATDEGIRSYQERMNNLRREQETGKDVRERVSSLSVEIGIMLIRKGGKKVDAALLHEILMLIKPYSIRETNLISSLHDIFQSYIVGFESLDEFCADYIANRDAFSRLAMKQIEGSRTRIAQDMEGVSIILEVLNNIVDDMSSAMGEEALKDRLIEYQSEILQKSKKLARFRHAVNCLGRMLRDKINVLNRIPNLIISHTGTMYGNEESSCTETWMKGVEYGYVRGVVFNCGGATAYNVSLDVMINGESRCVLQVKKIYANEKLPFCVQFSGNEIENNKISWNAVATYYDENGDKQRSSHGTGVIKINLVSTEWDTNNVGREQFNTQFAAEGEEFCGRNNEIMILNSLYNANMPIERYPSLLVTGLRRAGKSSVIKYFCKELGKRENLAPIYIDGQASGGNMARAFIINVNMELYKHYRKSIVGDFKAFKDKWDMVANQEDWIEQLPEFFFELSELLDNKKIIFILDEMETVFYGGYFNNAQSEERFLGMIRSLIQNSQEYVSFIFCGSDKLLTSCLEQKRESQLFQALQRIYVGRMTINDIHAIFDKYNEKYEVQFGDEAINTIMKYTNGLVWYTKVIAYNILDKIIDKQHIIRKEVHASDVEAVVELLISGDLGSELIDLLDNNFGVKRKAIIRAMANATKEQNNSVSVDMIAAELSRINYVDSETGEILGMLSEEEIIRNLNILEKMDFVQRDTQREKSYAFTTELYRLLMLSERKLNKFIVKR